ncbi:hypothetical protein JNUCC74_15120 [Cerasibacillus sp. JNUCC 74]
MLDVIKIIVPVLTSLVVCYITLYFTKKRNKEAMKLQQENHIENMKVSEKKYQEQLLISEENERLKHLPYLSLVPKYKKHRFEGEMEKVDNINIISIPFKIINEGAGIAFSIHLKYLDDDMKHKGMEHIAIAFKDNYDDGYNILGVSEPIDTDVLRVENLTEFCLYLTAINENLDEINPATNIRWEFDIMFCDIQGREYSQTYSFYSSTRNNKIFRVNSYMPQLIK